MKYAYENLSDDQFENLIVCICKKIFGIGTQGFAKGPDGGRDAKFTGTAQLFPSKASPWKGITIIQAKHVNAYNKSFSSSEFYGNKKSILGDELPKIKKLCELGELNNYILFSNRRMPAGAENTLKKVISSECGIPQFSIAIHGVYDIEGILKEFPDIATNAMIDPIDSPLLTSPDELADVIYAFTGHCDMIKDVTIAPPTARKSLKEKNALNKMSEEYIEELNKRHLKDMSQVQNFLALPENETVREKFQLAIDEFQSEIIAKRKDHQSFDRVLQAIKTLLTSQDELLHKNKRLTELMLFYMYWNCDIGKSSKRDNNVAPN